MTPIGSPSQWSDVVQPQVETILRLITRTWDELAAPPRNELEKPIALRLTASLQNAPDRGSFPFRVVPEFMILDGAGHELGRIDIAFMQFVCHDSVYFGIECKRLNSDERGEWRWYHTQYVNEGITRFVSSKYAELVDTGGMVGFVLNGDTATAISKVDDYIAQKRRELGMAASGSLVESTLCPDEARIRETQHERGKSHNFLLHHVFLAGNSNAPLRPEPPPVAKSPAKKKTTKRKPRK